MIINHNLNAMNAHRQMAINTGNNGKAIEKLSSGLRINRAGDDAAGLAISEKMRGQIRGLNQASRNSQDAISLIQTAEGALNETHSILQRMRELTVQAANDTNVTVDRENLQKEVAELQSEINRISSQTQFNTKSLINGAVSEDAKTLKVDKIKLDDTAANVTKQIATIDNAINSVSKERAKLGANQNRLEHTIANLDNSAENLQAAESRIRDVDMAKEMMNFTKTNILTQAAQAMLAQANQAPQGVLQLLR
ncbi:flagellin [Clostridium botulinum]